MTSGRLFDVSLLRLARRQLCGWYCQTHAPNWLPEFLERVEDGITDFAKRGFTVILATRPTETEKIVATFKKLMENPETSAWAKVELPGVTVEAPQWTEGIEGLRSDSWPIRAKVEKPTSAVDELLTVATKKRKATTTKAANPRTATRKTTNPRTAVAGWWGDGEAPTGPQGNPEREEAG